MSVINFYKPFIHKQLHFI